MSRFLHIESDPVDQPAATDSLEKATWSALRIRVGSRTVSRVLDKKLNDERSILYVPLFAVCEWIVSNWWALLNEPCRSEFVPPPDSDEPSFSWTKRHCLRAAESDLLLPALYLFSDGRDLRAVWRADTEDALPHMPAFFVDSGWEALEKGSAEQTLAQFVSNILNRVSGIDDVRARDVRDTWRAIQEADREERQFCVMAGRLGLNPYDREEVSDSLSGVLEQFADADDPLVQDITTAASSDSIGEQWRWIERAKNLHRLSGFSPLAFPRAESDFVRPSEYGYQLAREFRQRASLSVNQSLDSVEDLAKAVLGVRLEAVDENHLSGQSVKLIAGKSHNGTARLVGPRASRPENDRFRIARGLFQIAVGSARGPRLVTDAFTWNQQASRAFAAELIAPQQALKVRAGGWADGETIRELATEFQASTILIEKQLKNARVPIAED